MSAANQLPGAMMVARIGFTAPVAAFCRAAGE
jgi:hypothetical protein